MSRDTKFFIKFWTGWLLAIGLGFIVSYLLLNPLIELLG